MIVYNALKKNSRIPRYCLKAAEKWSRIEKKSHGCKNWVHLTLDYDHINKRISYFPFSRKRQKCRIKYFCYFLARGRSKIT